MLLRCTKKFLTELRLKKSEAFEPSTTLHPLDEWYAHIFYLYPRRKCAIFMHSATKFSFFTYDRNREQLADIKKLFCKGIGQALFDENYSAPVIKLFNERLENIQIGLAQDRRILGFMNQRVKDMKFMADYYPKDDRIHDEALAGLDSRRSPMVKERPSLAIEQMKEELSSCPELEGVNISPAGYKHADLEMFLETLHAKRHEIGEL